MIALKKEFQVKSKKQQSSFEKELIMTIKFALEKIEDPSVSEHEKKVALDTYNRATRALEISKLDLIAAYRIFSEIYL